MYEYNGDSNIITLKFRDHFLQVHMDLLGDNFPLKVGSLYQFIGELHNNNDNPINESSIYLQARVVRLVDGLDLESYIQAVQLKRKFFANIS